MCFIKQDSYKITKQPIYLIKSGCVHEDKCIARGGYVYRKGDAHKKGFRDKVKALFRKELNGEVFHHMGIGRSIAETAHFLNFCDRSGGMPERHYYRGIYGVFLIPAGSRIYVNSGYDEIVSFTTCFLGPINIGLAQKVMAQKHNMKAFY